METNVSKDNFLKSIESSNSSRAIPPGVTSSRKMGNGREAQVNARKVLKIEEVASHPSAIPPLSPPGLNDFDIEA